MKKKAVIWIVMGILVFMAVGVAGYFYLQNRPADKPEQAKDPNVVAGQQLADSGNVDAAIKKYQEILKNTPENADAAIALAQAYAKKGDIDKARKTIDHSINLVPTDTRLYDTMVKIYKDKGRYIDAMLFVDSIPGAEIKSKYETKLRDENFEAYVGFGNTPGNLANDGLVAISNNSVFYSEKMDGEALYRADKDSKNKVKLCDGRVRDINVIGDTVYFVNITEGYNIQSIKTDGTDHKTILKVFAQRMFILHDRLYYSNWSDNCKIYSAKLDGTGNKVFLDACVSEISLSGAWFYYFDRDQNDALFRVRIDGSQKSQLNEANCLFANGDREFIYYVNWSDSGKLYKSMRDESQAPAALTETKVGYVNAYKDWIYYVDWVKGENVYRMRMDGSDVQKVTDDPAKGVFVKDDEVYYYNTGDGQRLYKVGVNGKGRTLVGK